MRSRIFAEIINLDLSADSTESEAGGSLSSLSAIPAAMTAGTSVEGMQFNGECWMPIYDSKGRILRSLC